MSKAPPIDIRPDHWEIVRAILEKHVPQYEVWAFGSRAKWTTKEFSDLDLAIITDKPLPLAVSAALSDDFSESELPWKVDVVDWAAVGEKFQQLISQQRQVIKKAQGTAWRYLTVVDIAAPSKNALVGGPFGSNLVAKDYLDGGVPIIRGQNMAKRWIGGEFVYVSIGKAKSLEANIARPGDIVFTQRGTLGQVSIVPKGKYDQYLISQSQMKLTVDENIADKIFCYYLFLSPGQQDYIKSNAIQTGVPHTNLTILKKTPVRIPPISEQRAIAHILGTLDDKIECNRRMNETLEAIARAIFKDWFVDFGPVRAKAEGRQPEGMSAELAALFPDAFDDEGKPTGWDRKTLGEQFHVTMGQSPPGDTYNEMEEGVPFFQGRSDFGVYYPSRRVYCTAPTRLADQGDTLLSVRAPVGDINIAWENCCIGRGLAAIRHKSGAKFYTYAMLNELQSELRSYEHNGTVFGAINKQQLYGLSVIVPWIDIIKEFENGVATLEQRLVNNTGQSQTLIQLRDTLLPKLISGELRIKDAEKFVEEALDA